VLKGRREGINAGTKNPRAKLTMDEVRKIRRCYAAGDVSQQTLGDEFGVSQFAISQIVRNQRYKEEGS
jgi:DNA-binding XRE family transcriptional regulator